MSIYFVETASFTKRMVSLQLEAELRELQDQLAANPLAGALDAGTGGLRKTRLRDGARRKGKRSGARVHYLYLPMHDVIYLLFVYTKNEQLALTHSQKRQLHVLANAIRSEWS